MAFTGPKLLQHEVEKPKPIKTNMQSFAFRNAAMKAMPIPHCPKVNQI